MSLTNLIHCNFPNSEFSLFSELLAALITKQKPQKPATHFLDSVLQVLHKEFPEVVQSLEFLGHCLLQTLEVLLGLLPLVHLQGQLRQLVGLLGLFTLQLLVVRLDLVQGQAQLLVSPGNKKNGRMRHNLLVKTAQDSSTFSWQHSVLSDLINRGFVIYKTNWRSVHLIHNSEVGSDQRINLCFQSSSKSNT